jgi:hypothetical protein
MTAMRTFYSAGKQDAIRESIPRLQEYGFSYADIGRVFNLSRARIGQILADDSPMGEAINVRRTVTTKRKRGTKPVPKN